jgi:hypothetical protein
VLISFFGIQSCKRGSTAGFKSDNFSNGKAGELVLITDDQFFTDTLKKQVMDILTQPQPAINQIEPMFDILNFSNQEFKGTFQRHRSIVHFDINPDYSSNRITIEKNVWASPQIYVHIKGTNAETCVKMFLDQQNDFMPVLYDNDLKRLQTFYQNNKNAGIEAKIKEKFGYSLSVPQHYFVAREDPNFIWLRFKTAKNDRFIMIFKTPLKDLTKENLIKNRNEITKKYIPGAVKGAYPIVNENGDFPLYAPLTLGTKEGFEMRGIWESVKDHMGGSFYSFSFLDPSGENCITVDGFVYAPQEQKRDYIREVEAIVKSLK